MKCNALKRKRLACGLNDVSSAFNAAQSLICHWSALGFKASKLGISKTLNGLLNGSADKFWNDWKLPNDRKIIGDLPTGPSPDAAANNAPTQVAHL